MSNRKAAQEFIIAYIDKLLPGGVNKSIYEKLFAGMSDEQFDAYMKKLKTGEIKLSCIAPNFGKDRIELERNFALAKELGHEFFQQIWIPATDGSPSYLTPVKYLVMQLPLRRQAQLLSKKISIPEHNNSVDDLTGQPTGKSKGAKISYPEVQVMAAMGLDKSLVELMKYRGGDEKGFNAYNVVLDKTGRVSQKTIEPYASGVKSTRTLKFMLLGAHLRSTL